MISNRTKYAIKALLAIHRDDSDKPVHIYDIAKNENIPQKFLELIMLDLKKTGVIDSKRGKGGGYFLTMQPDDIKIGSVIRAFEGPIALLPCASLTNYKKCKDCADETTCSLRHLMQEVREKTAQILDDTSLTSLAAKPF
ncbi:MAG: transcriptional regulator [Alphaproteobacteria bacterium CG11_big_fil_rev_8_21_14_0_20_44_7]|nr:MAG: transcriptional regulator [Alphaproteobacteria bacterium CG11_big_fil_rev_8_21_14_0_20_44_7]